MSAAAPSSQPSLFDTAAPTHTASAPVPVSDFARDLAYRSTATERLIALLTSRPGERFEAMSLANYTGTPLSWRTRISEASRALKAQGIGHIENTQSRRPNGSIRSTYHFVPAGSEDSCL